MRTSIRSISNAKRYSAAVTASVFALSTLTASMASAQTEATVSPDGKGIVGGALLGAEVGTIVESIAGVHSPWVYVVTDLVLGIGGGIGGWEVEQQVENHGWDVRVPVFMLAGGLGLIIPAVVLTLNATRYQPSENASEDHAPTNAPVANPGAPGGSIVGPSPAAPSSTPSPAAYPPSPNNGGATPPPPTPPPQSLFDVNGDGMRLGLPVPQVRPMFSANEMRQYGLTQQTEVRMSLLKIAF
jgi:hypothetical protein